MFNVCIPYIITSQRVFMILVYEICYNIHMILTESLLNSICRKFTTLSLGIKYLLIKVRTWNSMSNQICIIGLYKKYYNFLIFYIFWAIGSLTFLVRNVFNCCLYWIFPEQPNLRILVIYSMLIFILDILWATKSSYFWNMKNII